MEMDFNNLIKIIIVAALTIQIIGFAALMVQPTTTSVTLTGDAVAGDVLNGKTFYSNSTNKLTGTLATQYLSPTTPHITAGYYDTNDLNTIDADLNTTNILESRTIFGITGTAFDVNYEPSQLYVTITNGDITYAACNNVSFDANGINQGHTLYNNPTVDCFIYYDNTRQPFPWIINIGVEYAGGYEGTYPRGRYCPIANFCNYEYAFAN